MKNLKSLLCREVNQIDLVAYLSMLTISPVKVQGNHYWFRSPLRSERTASPKINRKLNKLYDLETGKGGTLVDFEITYFNCTAKDLLFRFKNHHAKNISFQPQLVSGAIAKKEAQQPDTKINIIIVSPISNQSLKNYLEQRKIPLDIAGQFCKEISFEIIGKTQYAIGFKNNADGYQLRNLFFKGSSSPKELTIIHETVAKRIVVVEVFFDFLSFQILRNSMQAEKLNLPIMHADFLVFNSISVLEKNGQQWRNIKVLIFFSTRIKEELNLPNQR